MSDSATYHWQAAYVPAILENDDSRICSRIYEAIAAIERRRLTSVNSDEDLALTQAEAGLQILISETTGKYV